MKKIFLTSGLVLCMACPAFADTYPLGDIGTNGKLVIANAEPGADPVSADCTINTLGEGGYTGPVVLEAKWVSNQATITLDDNYYINPESDTVTWAPATPVPTAEKTLYTVYGVANSTPGAGVFYIPSGQSTKTAISNLTADTPAKTGYTFNGFWTQKGGEGTRYISSAGEISSSLADYLSGVNATGTLYAHWTANQYTISYAPGLAGSRPANYVQNSTSSTTGVDFDDTNIQLAQNGFTATGYHFTGWRSSFRLTDNEETTTIYGTAGSNYNDDYTGGTISVYRHPDDITLTATWAPNKYTVSYLCTGGEPSTASTRPATGTVNSVEVTFDAGYTLDDGANCHLDGYTFNGWSCTNGLSGALVSTTENDVTTISPASGTWSLTTDSVCTAQWTANTIGLTWKTGYGANGVVPGTAESSPNCTYDSTIVVPEDPGREGYTFQGWRVVSSN